MKTTKQNKITKEFFCLRESFEMWWKLDGIKVVSSLLTYMLEGTP